MLFIVESTTNYINNCVISDDNDVFIQILLAHICHERYITCHVTMEATSKERKFADIQATSHVHRDVVCQLLADYVKGADT